MGPIFIGLAVTVAAAIGALWEARRATASKTPDTGEVPQGSTSPSEGSGEAPQESPGEPAYDRRPNPPSPRSIHVPLRPDHPGSGGVPILPHRSPDKTPTGKPPSGGTYHPPSPPRVKIPLRPASGVVGETTKQSGNAHAGAGGSLFPETPLQSGNAGAGAGMLAFPLMLGGNAHAGAGGATAVAEAQGIRIGEPGPLPAPAPSASPAILALQQALDATWPQRAKTSDSLLSSTDTPSDHRDGNAIDITYDAVSGPDMDRLMDGLWLDPRTEYEIWANQIRTRSDTAWRPYCDGAEICNPHTRHAHLSIDPAQRSDAAPWNVGSASMARSSSLSAGMPPPSSMPGGAPVASYLKEAWGRGLVDNVHWVPVTIGPFVVEVASEPLAVQGLRIPTSASDAAAILRTIGAILPTREIADAIWGAAARRKTPAPPPSAPTANT